MPGAAAGSPRLSLSPRSRGPCAAVEREPAPQSGPERQVGRVPEQQGWPEAPGGLLRAAAALGGAPRLGATQVSAAEAPSARDLLSPAAGRNLAIRCAERP